MVRVVYGQDRVKIPSENRRDLSFACYALKNRRLDACRGVTAQNRAILKLKFSPNYFFGGCGKLNYQLAVEQARARVVQRNVFRPFGCFVIFPSGRGSDAVALRAKQFVRKSKTICRKLAARVKLFVMLTLLTLCPLLRTKRDFVRCYFGQSSQIRKRQRGQASSF